MKKLLGVGLTCLLAGCSAHVTASTPAPPPAHAVAVADAPEVDIPPGHMPPPGACRLWYPGEPPGHQPAAGDCDELERSTPRGAWLLYRPDAERRVVRIR
jgi:hypothetical protein